MYKLSSPITKFQEQPRPRTPALSWRRHGADWILLAERRRFGRVIPDSRHPGMWRSVMSSGALSDMANLARAKGAVLAAAELELEYEPAIAPRKCPEKRGVFWRSASPIAQNVREALR